MKIKNQLLSVFGISMILTLVLSGYFLDFSEIAAVGLEELGVYQEETAEALEGFRDIELVLLNDAWELKYLDESLSHTIVRYIQSGGQSYWDLRYQKQSEELKAAFESADKIADPEDYDVLEYVKEAHREMAKYDTQIRAVVAEAATIRDQTEKEAKLSEAENLLYGDYETYRVIYAGGLRDFFISQQERLDESISLRVSEAQLGLVKAEGLIIEARDGQARTVLMIGAIFVVNAVLAARFSYRMTSRIGKLKKVSDKLSMGEIEGLEVDISGDDEIMELGEALKGVIAAFNTILFDAVEEENAPLDNQVIDTPIQDLEVD